MKTCSKCGIAKDVSEFSARKASKDGLQRSCRSCCAEYRRRNRDRDRERLQARRAANPERYREYNRRTSRAKTLKKYDLTVEEYDLMLASQLHLCLICGEVPKDRLVVDHNHQTGEVRGLLCRNCNAGIGQLKDDPTLLLRAALYLLDPSCSAPSVGS